MLTVLLNSTIVILRGATILINGATIIHNGNTVLLNGATVTQWRHCKTQWRHSTTLLFKHCSFAPLYPSMAPRFSSVALPSSLFRYESYCCAIDDHQLRDELIHGPKDQSIDKNLKSLINIFAPLSSKHPYYKVYHLLITITSHSLKSHLGVCCLASLTAKKLLIITLEFQ